MEVNTVDISPKDKEIFFSLFRQYLPNTSAWAYGSRITGNARPWSDLDIVVFTDEKQKYPISLLKEALDESNLTFRVDLLEWKYLPDNFKANISANYVKIFP